MKKAKKKAPKKQAKKQVEDMAIEEKPEPEAVESECESVDESLEDSGIEKVKLEPVMIVGNHPNPMWKKGKTDGGKGEGCKVWVPKRLSHKLRLKVVECERVDENGETYYKYNP